MLHVPMMLGCINHGEAKAPVQRFGSGVGLQH
jgi:hypothetical protein